MIEDGQYRFEEGCDRVADVLRRIGDKWSVLIVVLLELGPRRFNDLRRAIPGISQRMLTLTLRGLEREGLVERLVTASIPPHVSYSLTSMGHSLAGPVGALCVWAESHFAKINAASRLYDEKHCT